MEKFIAAMIGLVLGTCVIAVLAATPFMVTWNYVVVPAIEVANPINFWQALWSMLFFNVFITPYKKSEQ